MSCETFQDFKEVWLSCWSTVITLFQYSSLSLRLLTFYDSFCKSLTIILFIFSVNIIPQNMIYSSLFIPSEFINVTGNWWLKISPLTKNHCFYLSYLINYKEKYSQNTFCADFLFCKKSVIMNQIWSHNHYWIL